MTTQPNALLQVTGGLSSKEPLFLTDQLVKFGKSASSDVVLDNPFVSRNHFEIRFDDGIFYVTDVGSKNGTKVNKGLLAPNVERKLQNGDLITLAEDLIQLVFRDIGEETFTVVATGTSSASKVEIDSGSKEVWVRGEKISPPLAPKEFLVLALLHSRAGDVIDKDDIALHGWAERDDGDVGDHEIEQCIRRIRRRIEENPREPRIILTRKGFGYVMAEDTD